jgi:predicted small metal-binding protein
MEKMKSKSGKLLKIECDPMCGFMVRSHDEGEVLRLARTHVTDAHKMHATTEILRSKMMPA